MLFDLLLLFTTTLAAYLGFKWGTHIEIYRLARAFTAMTVATSLAAEVGWGLTRQGILAANNQAMVLLIGFVIVFILFWCFTLLMEALFRSVQIHKYQINHYIGAVANALITLVLVSILAFFSTQLQAARGAYKAYLREQSLSYLYIDRACRALLTEQLVDEIIGHSAARDAVENILKH